MKTYIYLLCGDLGLSDELTSNTERDIFTEWNSRQSKPSTWKRIIFLHKVEATLSVKDDRKISDVAVIK